jgi:hypothetical protein
MYIATTRHFIISRSVIIHEPNLLYLKSDSGKLSTLFLARPFANLPILVTTDPNELIRPSFNRNVDDFCDRTRLCLGNKY